MYSKSYVLAGLFGVTMIVCVRDGLADIIIVPELNSKLVIDDNIKLATNGKKNATSIEISPQLNVHHQVERAEMHLRTALRVRRFDHDKTLNSNEQEAAFHGNYRFERSLFQWNMELDNRNTLSSEREATGLIETAKQRRRWQLQPQWSKQLSERAQMNVRYSWLGTDYQGNASKGLLDYTFHEIASHLSYAHTGKQKMHGLFYASDYRAEQSQLTTRTVGISLGLDRLTSEKSKLALSGGVRFYKNVQTLNRSTQQVKLSEQSHALVLKIAWEINLYQGQVATSYVRSLTPSGAGSMMQEDQLTLFTKYQLKERNKLTFALNLLRQEKLTDTDNERFLFSMDTAYRYQMKKNLLTSVGYKFTAQHYQPVTKTAFSNRIVVDIKYTWDRLRLDYF